MANLQMDSFVTKMNILKNHNVGYYFYENENLELIKIILEEIFMDMERFSNNCMTHGKYLNKELRGFVEDINYILMDKSSMQPDKPAECILNMIRNVISLCNKDFSYDHYYNDLFIVKLLEVIEKCFENDLNPKRIDTFTFIFNTISNYLLHSGESLIHEVDYNIITNKFISAYECISRTINIINHPDLYNSIRLTRIAIIKNYIKIYGEDITVSEITMNGCTYKYPCEPLKELEDKLHEGIFKSLDLSVNSKISNIN